MMRTILLASICALWSTSFLAQEPASDSLIHISVNETLWRPFKKAFDQKDAKAFNALHTKDVMRVTPNGIRLGEEYLNSNIEHFQQNPDRSQMIDFALEHRVYAEDQGYEVGFYRIIYSIDDIEVHRSYARFHVRLRLVEGEWKIAQDWDVHQINGKKFEATDFEKAELLKL